MVTRFCPIAVFQVVAVATLGLTGCAPSQANSGLAEVAPTIVEYQVRNVPGVVEYTWEEPMVDVIEVPPGLDPEGVFYRPAHQEVVEVRQGKWQYSRKPSR